MGRTRGHTAKYQKYINSTKWERRKVSYYAHHPKVCRACAATELIHLHHHTYDRLGKEADDDMVPLCESCHELVHNLHRLRGGSLTKVTMEFIEFYQKPSTTTQSDTGFVPRNLAKRTKKPRRTASSPKSVG